MAEVTELDAVLRKVAEEAGSAAGRAAVSEHFKALIDRIGELEPSVGRELRTIPQIAAECRAFSKSGLYKLVERCNDELREAGCIFQVAGRTYIHRQKFDRWLASQQASRNLGAARSSTTTLEESSRPGRSSAGIDRTP